MSYATARARLTPFEQGLDAIADRTRELLNLVVVGMLTARRLRVRLHRAPGPRFGTASLSYAALLPRASSWSRTSSTRRTLPYADPFLLPIGGAADGDRPDRDLPDRAEHAFRRASGSSSASLLFAATIVLLRGDYRKLESYKYLFGLGAVGLLALPALPGIGADGERRAPLGRRRRLQVQPGEFAKMR